MEGLTAGTEKRDMSPYNGKLKGLSFTESL